MRIRPFLRLAVAFAVLVALGAEADAAQLVSFYAVGGGDKQLTAASFDNAAASGDTTAVAAAAAKVNRVYRLFIVAAGATNITFKCGSTAMTGAMAFAANQGMVLDFQAEPWFECANNTGFVINSSNAVSVTGAVYYTQG